MSEESVKYIFKATHGLASNAARAKKSKIAVYCKVYFFQEIKESFE